MKESWFERYSLFVEQIREKPSKVKVERFLRYEVPGMEKRLLEVLARDSNKLKRNFTEWRASASIDYYDLPEYVRTQLDGMAALYMDGVSGLPKVDLAMHYDFFGGFVYLASAITFAKTPKAISEGLIPEKEVVKIKTEVSKDNMALTGLAYAGPSLEEMKIFQSLLEQDPTGFSVIDFHLEFMKRVAALNKSHPRARITMVGAVFGARAYKAIYRSLSS